jgi:hypothetical protein
MGKLINTCILVGYDQEERIIGDQHQIPIYEKWVVEIHNNGKLQDIIEMPFDSEALAWKECEKRYADQSKDNEILMESYGERLRARVMDEVIDDRDPVEPTYYRLKFIPAKYLMTLAKDGRYHTLIYSFNEK